MSGGVRKPIPAKVFNLLHAHPNLKKHDVQNNIKRLLKQYGKMFTIKYGSLLLENVIIVKKKLANGQSFYSLVYDIPYRTHDIKPLMIEFIDLHTSETNNNTYISHISRTDKISGTEMIQICIQINKVLGVNKTFLYDGASVVCPKNNESMNLSFQKLIEKGITFYMKFGFEFEVTDSPNILFYYRFKNKNDFMHEIQRVLNNIRAIKTIDLIKEYTDTLKLALTAISENYKKKLEIIKNVSSNVAHDNMFYDENPQDQLTEIVSESKEVLDVLNKYRHLKYFYQIMTKTFNDDCGNYLILVKNIIDNFRHAFIYGNTQIKKEYSKNFRLLHSYMNKYSFSFQF
jgi:hypothetical protein